MRESIAPSCQWTLSHNNSNNKEQCKSRFKQGRQDQSAKALEDQRKLKSEVDSLDGNKLGYGKYVKLLQACGKTRRVAEGRKVHAEVVKLGLDDNFMSSHITQMYLTCGCLDEGRRLFSRMRRRNVVLWTSMIKAYAQCGHYKQALELFEQMKEEVSPDKIAFITVLGACGNRETLEEGRDIHAQVVKCGFENDSIIQSALVHMYGKAGSLEDAELVFDKMVEKDVVTWTAMIVANTDHGRCTRALELYEKMQRRGVAPNKHTYLSVLNACVKLVDSAHGRKIHERVISEGLHQDVMVGTALVNMYGKCGRLEDAQLVFNELQDRDTVSWSSMITTYSEHEQYRNALHLFREMQLSGTSPNAVTLSIVLGACANLAAIAEGMKIHKHIDEDGFEKDSILEAALVNMYGKCGKLEEAHRVFDHLHDPRVISWNAIIAAYAEQGHGTNALKLFFRMQQGGVRPDHSTFQSALSACSHAGKVELGCQLYGTMLRDHGGFPTFKHHGCMVDLLGRARRLEEAERFIDRVQSSSNSSALWMILLNACRAQGDLERAKRIVRQVIALDPLNAEAYIVLSNMYAAVGSWDVVGRIRKFMLDKGVRDEPGRSLIEVKSRLHEFTTEDRSHPQLKAIHAELDRLTEEMNRAGYVADTSVMLDSVEEERKEDMLKHHSEKLAIAFGVMSTPNGSPLRIVKNGRVCSDCHSAAKLISKLTRREILLRDTRRSHLFEKGRCCCGDYW